MRKILPSYDNALTGEWLFSVLADLGVAQADGRMEFRVAKCPEGSGLLRVEADFVFRKACTLHYGGQGLGLQTRRAVWTFFSYRHTPEQLQGLFLQHNLSIQSQWLNSAGDEGVFLIR